MSQKSHRTTEIALADRVCKWAFMSMINAPMTHLALNRLQQIMIARRKKRARKQNKKIIERPSFLYNTTVQKLSSFNRSGVVEKFDTKKYFGPQSTKAFISTNTFFTSDHQIFSDYSVQG